MRMSCSAGRKRTRSIDNVKENYPTLVDELIPNVLSIGDIQKVLVNLLKEKVSIRDLVTILETLADYGNYTKDPDVLTEYVRQALSRQITQQYARENEPLRVITVGPNLEKLIADSVQQTERGSYLALDPNVTQTIFQKLNEQVTRLVQPVIIRSS